MADYKGIKGFKVQSHASDPTANEGQIWYNTTSYALKFDAVGAGAWASAPAINTGRGVMACTGIVTAALIFGGTPGYAGETELYNGSTWSEKSDLIAGVENNIGFGTSTAAVNCGGLLAPSGTDSNNTETWDGTSWTTSPANMTTARSKLSAANQGTTTAGLIFAGSFPGTSTNVDLTESWNGSAWTEVADINTARRGGAGGGTQAAAFLATGYIGPGANFSTAVETWNGTSWSQVNIVNTARQTAGSAGTTTTALIYGGNPGQQAVTEKWDGTCWSEVADLGTGREGLGKGTGLSGTSALAVGKDGSPNTLTEVWDGAPAVVKTVTVS